MKKKIELSLEEARDLYKTGDATFKAFLEKNFDKKDLSTKVTDRVKNWEDVCKELSITNEVLPYIFPKTKQEISINAFAKIQYISQCLNEGWTPTWTNSSEYKFYPWFEQKSSRSGFGFSSYYGYALGGLGFGFYYKSRELSDYAGTQFLTIYKEYLGN